MRRWHAGAAAGVYPGVVQGVYRRGITRVGTPVCTGLPWPGPALAPAWPALAPETNNATSFRPSSEMTIHVGGQKSGSGKEHILDK